MYTKAVSICKKRYASIRCLFVSHLKKTAPITKNAQKFAGEIVVSGLVGAITLLVFFPSAAIADIDTGPHYPNEETVSLLIGAMQNKTIPHRSLPMAESAAARRTYTIPVTAYSSTVDQCDDDPFTTANGDHVYDGGIATNFLPFGTKVKIPEYFGDKVFTVNDRMNKRYDYRADVWMETREEAIQFGIQYVTIEVF